MDAHIADELFGNRHSAGGTRPPYRGNGGSSLSAARCYPRPVAKTWDEGGDRCTKAERERLDDRATRLEERRNSLHNYILALPIRPGPYAPQGPTRRGDLNLELPIEKGMNW